MARILAAAIAALFLCAGASAADDLQLTVAAETSSTITLSWSPVTGADGYDFSVKGLRVSQTRDGSRSSVRFAKVMGCDFDCYAVEAWQKLSLAKGGHPKAPAPTAPPNLRTTSVTQTSVALAWDSSTSPKGMAGYQVFRDGVKIGEGPGEAGGFANAWADGGRTCATRYVYGVAGVDTSGAVGKTSTIAVTTASCSTPPPPPPGGTISSADCSSRASVAGAVIANVTVSGDCDIHAANVTIQNTTVTGVVYVSAAGFQLLTSKAQGFELGSGADGALLQGNTFDGRNQKEQNFVWAAGKVGDGPTGWVIRGNSFTNYTSPGTTHSEALFIGGYASNGLIESNTFYRNGNTGHIFFSWCAPNDCSGTGGTPRDPHDICVRSNSFLETWIAYYQVVVRQETNAPNGHGIYTDDNIRISPSPNQSPPEHRASTDSNNTVQFMAGDNLIFQQAC